MEKETIKCEICGDEMTQLGRHLKMKHGINGKEYQLKFQNAPLMSEARRKKNSDKSISPNNIEFWLKKGLSEKEATDKLDNHKKKISESSKLKSSFSLQYWIKQGLSTEESKIKISNVNRRDESYFIEKYGLEKGKKKFTEMQIKKAYSNSKKRLFDEGLSDNDIEKYSKKRWNQTSRESFIIRLGEEQGQIEYVSYCLKQKVKSKRSLDYWLNQGLSIEDAKIELKRFQSRGLNFWISKYGENNGLKKYKIWVENIRKTSNISGVSKSSQEFFKEFFDNFKYAQNIHYNDYCGMEYFIINKDGFKLYIDCYFEYDGQKYGIEFNGDYWHANPNVYVFDDEISYPGKKLKAADVWYRDSVKKQDIESENIKLFYVWESDFYYDSALEICKIINVIEKGKLNDCKC